MKSLHHWIYLLIIAGTILGGCNSSQEDQTQTNTEIESSTSTDSAIQKTEPNPPDSTSLASDSTQPKSLMATDSALVDPSITIPPLPPEPPNVDYTPKNFDSDGYVEITWNLLKNVAFQEEYNALENANILKPYFGDIVNAMENQQVYISGYIVPVDISTGWVVLSANPNSSCFFCGGAGPESVLDLKFAPNRPQLKVDQWVKVKGRLTLNRNDIYNLPYILEDVKVY